MAKDRPTGFGQRLRRLREAAGLTQEELGKRIGMHTLTVAALEQGRRDPLWSSVIDCAEALGVPVTEFVVPKKERVAPEKRPRGRPRKNGG
jgi:transcriptional regulator with XRE-family HTH domain